MESYALTAGVQALSLTLSFIAIEPTSGDTQVVVDRGAFATQASPKVAMRADTLRTARYKPTYSDIIAFTTEPTSVTIPWLTRGYPKELHRDLESTNPPQMLGLLYEASIAPAFLFFDDHVPFSVTITPKIILRQLYQESDPVIPAIVGGSSVSSVAG